MSANNPGMATGIEVARISVKVSPDTRKFRRELQNELEAIENSVKATVPVEAKAQTAKAEAQLNNAARTRTAQLKVDVDQGLLQSYAKLTERLKGNISPGLKGEMFARQIDGMVAAFNKKYPLGVKLDPSDVREVIAEIAALKKLMVEGDSSLGVIPDREMSKRQEMLRQLDELSKIRLTVDDSDLKAKVDRLKAELDKPIPLGISVEDRIARSRIEAQFNALRDELSNKKIKVEVDKDSLVESAVEAVGEAVETAAKVAGTGAKGIGDGIGGGGGKSKLFPKFGTGVNPAGWAVILAGVVAAAGPVVGLISTALAALPGLISLLLAPIAAVTLGLQGFKDAAAAIKPQFEQLKNIMNEASKAAFTPVLQRVADEIFPKLAASLPEVTQGLADISKGILDGLAGPRLENIITRIGDAFSAMRPGMEGFSSGFLGLVDEFTKGLPGISQWVEETGAAFDRWVQKVSANGSLQAAFGNLGTVLKEIGSVVTDLAVKGIDFLSDPAKVQGTIDVIRGVKDVLNDIMSISGKIAENWDKIFGNALPNFDPKDGLSDAKIMEPLTSKDAPWRKMMPWLSEKFPAPSGAQQQVEAVGKAIDETAGKAEAATPKVEQFLLGSSAGKGLSAVQGPGLNGDMPTAEPPKIEPPNTEEAKAKLEEYNTFVEKVSADVKTAMQAGTEGGTVPPPNLDAFKQAWNDLPNIVQQAAQAATDAAGRLVNGVVTTLSAGGNAVVAAVTSWPVAVQAALSSMNAIGAEAGSNLANGMVAGINNGIGWVTAAARNLAAAAKNAAKAELDSNSPSKVFIKIGEDTAKGMAIGLENGIEPVVAQAKDLASKVADVFAKNGDPTPLLEGFGGKEVKRIEKVLAFESKRLGIQAKALDYQAKTTGNTALKAQADAIRSKKEELDLQKEMLDLTREYAELSGDEKFSDSPLGKAAQSLMDMPQDFLRSTGEQFLSDIGIDGGGAVSAIADYGMGMANKYIFNVSNVDEAMAVHQRQVYKQGMGVVGR